MEDATQVSLIQLDISIRILNNLLRSSLKFNGTRREALIPPRVVKVHAYASHRHKQQQPCVGPVARRISLLCLVRLVDPHAHDLSRCAHGNIECDGETDGARGVQVR